MANEQTSVPLYAAAEVLTAANMNISAGTGVPVFATTVTRDAAFGGAGEKVLAEGQLCYLSDSNIVQYYTGAAWATVGPTTVQEASFAEYQASGTAGGASVTGSFLKRILNTTINNSITGCTLTSSVIALPAGTYTFVANSTFVQPNEVQIKLRNTTDSTNTIFGTTSNSSVTTTDPTCTLVGSFTITGTKNFEIQYRVANAKAGDGLGRNVNFETNCFTNCVITKVA